MSPRETKREGQDDALPPTNGTNNGIAVKKGEIAINAE